MTIDPSVAYWYNPGKEGQAMVKRMSDTQRWLALRALLTVADAILSGILPRDEKDQQDEAQVRLFWENVTCDVVQLLDDGGRTPDNASERRKTVRALFEAKRAAKPGSFTASLNRFADLLRIPPNARRQPGAHVLANAR